MKRKKKKDQMENSSTEPNPTTEALRTMAPEWPCTRQGPLFTNASHRGGWPGGSICFSLLSLRVAIILGGSRRFGKYKKPDHQSYDLLLPLIQQYIIFYNMCVDVSEWSIQNAGTVVCVCLGLSISDHFPTRYFFYLALL